MFLKKHKILFLSFLIFFTFSFIIRVFADAPPGGYDAGATLTPDCLPGALLPEPCIVNISGGGSDLWSENGSDIYFSGGKVGVGLDSPLANFHILATQTLIPGTPRIPGTVGTTSYTGVGLDDATFGGQYDGGTEDCQVLAGIQDVAPGNGFANDRFVFGFGGGPGCNGGGGPVEITPGVAQYLVNGITITFASGTGHTLLEMSPLNELWSADLTVGIAEIPDEYIPGDDPFLITDEDGNELFNIDTNGGVIIQTQNGTNPLEAFIDGVSVFRIKDGNITLGSKHLTINTVDYWWPSTQAAADGYVLTNDGAGVLTWEAGGGGDNLFTLDDDGNLFDSRAGNGTMTGTNNIFSGSYAGQSNTTGSHNIFSGYYSGLLNTMGDYNIFSGSYAGQSNTSGSNNIFSGRNAGYSNSTGGNNIFFGETAGYNNIDGGHNIFSGYRAGFNNNGSFNIFLGSDAGYSNTTGNSNVFLGYGTGASNTDGFDNVAVGGNALGSNIGGYRNTSMGVNSLYGNTTGNYNTAAGFSSLAANTTGYQNSAFGLQALYSNTTGNDNTALGYQAGFSNTTSTDNVFIGKNAGYNFNGLGGYSTFIGSEAGENNSVGYYNIFAGYNAGTTSTVGANNTIIGANADVAMDSSANAIALGYGAIAGSNQFALPDDVTQIKFRGVNYVMPTDDGIGALTSDGSGNLSWAVAGGLTGLTETNNTFLGIRAGDANSGVNANTFIGFEAGLFNTTGSNNTAIGQFSLRNNTDGSEDTATGSYSLGSNTSGTYNTATGAYSLGSNTTGNNNTAHGYAALYSNITGNYNTASGYDALRTNVSGDLNAVLGYRADVSTDSTSDAVAIGANATAHTNGIALGSNATASLNEFALSDSITKFKFQGDSYTLPTSYPGASGYVLSSTNAGVMSWAAQTSSPISVGTNTTTLYSSGLSGTGQGNTGSGNNIILGVDAGSSATSAFYANFLGYSAGKSATSAYYSNFFGHSSGLSASNANNSNFFGHSAGQSASSADNSNFLGASAGQSASSAQYSNFLGLSAGNTATNASNSNFFGQAAGSTATNASYSNFIGYGTGNSATNASNSNFFGQLAGYQATNSSNSIFIGYYAGASNGTSTGSQNANNSIFIGKNAGYTVADFTLNNLSSGTSILIGDDTSTGGFSNSIAIGKGATNTATNQFMIGSATSPIDEMIIVGNGASCAIDNNIYGDGSTGLNCSSDERLKTNITGLSSVLEALQNIETVTYNWKANPNSNQQIGFIAQNLETYFPEIVREGHDGYLQVNYASMTPILTKAIQELDLKITEIENISNQSFKDYLISWFGDIENGIQSFFASEVHTDKICVKKSDGSEVCVTGDELEEALGGVAEEEPAPEPIEEPTEEPSDEPSDEPAGGEEDDVEEITEEETVVEEEVVVEEEIQTEDTEEVPEGAGEGL